jgi:hypothetical protein
MRNEGFTGGKMKDFVLPDDPRPLELLNDQVYGTGDRYFVSSKEPPGLLILLDQE